MNPKHIHESGRIITHPTLAVYADSRVRLLRVKRDYGDGVTVRIWRGGVHVGVLERGPEGWYT